MAASLLVAEFEKWNSDTAEGNIFLLEATDKDDGTCTILFSLCGEHEFILHCPHGYPKNQDRFVVETAAIMQSWANNLNEYLLDSPTSPCLNSILSKAVHFYKSRGKISVSSDDESPDEDEDSELASMTDDETFTTEWELKLARIKKKWIQKEMQLRAEMAKNKHLEKKPVNRFGTNERSQAKQIFSNTASSGVLTNDLVAIMENENENGISAEPIDDNIYLWTVKLFKFESSSALQEELMQINEKFNYNYIELTLEFTMDMYPFYPPLVKVVRPRLQPAMMQRVTSMELLKLSYWNPARDMLSILKEIKTFLQQWARLEVDTKRNDLILYVGGAYLEIEHQLLKLAMVSEVYPRANCKYAWQLEQLPRQAPTIIDKTKKTGGKEYWASGTGYGSGLDQKRPQWDVTAYIAAQKLKDEQIVTVLQSILEELKQSNNNNCGVENNRQLPNGNGAECPMDVEMMEVGGNLGTLNSCSSISMDINQAGSSTSTSSLTEDSDLYQVIEGSALIPFLETNLKECSFLEIGRHSSLFSAIVDVIKEIAIQSRLVPLLGSLSHQDVAVVDYLLQLKEQASLILNRLSKVEANGSIPQMASKPQSSAAAVPAADEKIAREFSILHKIVSSRLLQECKDKEIKPSTSSELVSSNQPEEVLYQKCLKKYQFANFSFATNGVNTHAHMTAFSKAAKPNSATVFRIAQELASLSASLPLNLSSSIFVRVDEDKFPLLRAVITGPEDTPYSGGCFQFDVYFPDKYPAGPPLVLIRTTGNGAVRFNPNLYACGKVCLSLLGTWHGQQGEQWNSETSTLLQVLVSIQSLIMVPDPYFNEPGYESQIGTDRGKTASHNYNEDVRVNNIRFAMIEQLHNPTPGFEDVIRLHFFLQKKRILQTVNSWVTPKSSANLRKYIGLLETELCNLQLSSDLQDLVQSVTEEPMKES